MSPQENTQPDEEAPAYFDAHCHIDFPCFDASRQAVIARALEAKVSGLLIAGTSPTEWPRHRRIAEQLTAKVPRVYWSAGYHPEWVARDASRNLDAEANTEGERQVNASVEPYPPAVSLHSRKALISQEEQILQQLEDALCAGAVAVGEIGLDRRFKALLPIQERWFRVQLSVARACNRPIILHLVGTYGTALELLRRDGVPEAGGMVHAWSGPPSLVKEFEALGLILSFGGLITRVEARRARAGAQLARRYLLESDAPDLVPRGWQGLNEPSSLPMVATTLAELRDEPLSQVRHLSQQWALTLFAPS